MWSLQYSPCLDEPYEHLVGGIEVGEDVLMEGFGLTELLDGLPGLELAELGVTEEHK